MATCRHGVALNKHCQSCETYGRDIRASVDDDELVEHTPATAPMHGGRPMILHEIAEDERRTAEMDHIRERVVVALPLDAVKRKAIPIHSGFIKYFPRAMAAVAELSRVGNDQHNPGTPLHWDRSKSGDELDALTRHLLEAGTMDTDGVRHSTKLAWRAMANLEKELEAAADV